MNQSAVVEACVQVAVPNFRKCRAGNLVMQLDLDQRIAVERLCEKVAETEKLRICERADARPARRFAGERLRLAR